MVSSRTDKARCIFLSAYHERARGSPSALVVLPGQIKQPERGPRIARPAAALALSLSGECFPRRSPLAEGPPAARLLWQIDRDAHVYAPMGGCVLPGERCRRLCDRPLMRLIRCRLLSLAMDWRRRRPPGADSPPGKPTGLQSQHLPPTNLDLPHVPLARVRLAGLRWHSLSARIPNSFGRWPPTSVHQLPIQRPCSRTNGPRFSAADVRRLWRLMPLAQRADRQARRYNAVFPCLRPSQLHDGESIWWRGRRLRRGRRSCDAATLQRPCAARHRVADQPNCLAAGLATSTQPSAGPARGPPLL